MERDLRQNQELEMDKKAGFQAPCWIEPRAERRWPTPCKLKIRNGIGLRVTEWRNAVLTIRCNLHICCLGDGNGETKRTNKNSQHWFSSSEIVCTFWGPEKFPEVLNITLPGAFPSNYFVGFSWYYLEDCFEVMAPNLLEMVTNLKS